MGMVCADSRDENRLTCQAQVRESEGLVGVFVGPIGIDVTVVNYFKLVSHANLYERHRIFAYLFNQNSLAILPL
jgi:hypothetical protein